MTWQASKGLPDEPTLGFGRMELAFARADPEVIYASVDSNQGEVFRSSDGGKTFSLRNPGSNYLGGEGWYANSIWADDPQTADLVIVGGLDLYRSTDGGATLKQISFWYNAPVSPAAHHHAIVGSPRYDGKTNKSIYFGNNGGVYRAEDILKVSDRSGWEVMNTGYAATKFNGAAGHAPTGKIVGGTRSDGTLVYRLDGADRWTTMVGGQGGVGAIDPTDPKFVYSEYVNLRINRSVDGGRTAEFIFEGIPDAAEFSKSNWIAPFVLDQTDPNIMLAGGSGLWRSRNVKAGVPAWTRVKPECGSEISAIAVSAKAPGVIWVGHNDGQVYKTSHGGNDEPTWSRLDKGGTHLPKRACTWVVIDPADPEYVYVTFGGYARDNIWKTTDGGTTFKNIGASLPPAPAYALTIYPENSNLLWLGNLYGVFVSRDGGATWSPVNEGPVNSPVRELFWMNR